MVKLDKGSDWDPGAEIRVSKCARSGKIIIRCPASGKWPVISTYYARWREYQFHYIRMVVKKGKCKLQILHFLALLFDGLKFEVKDPNCNNILLSKAHLSLILSQINWAVFIQHQASDPAPRSLIHCSVYLAPAPLLQSINDRSWLGHRLVLLQHGPGPPSSPGVRTSQTCHAILFTVLRHLEYLSMQFNAVLCLMV